MLYCMKSILCIIEQSSETVYLLATWLWSMAMIMKTFVNNWWYEVFLVFSILKLIKFFPIGYSAIIGVLFHYKDIDSNQTIYWSMWNIRPFYIISEIIYTNHFHFSLSQSSKISRFNFQNYYNFYITELWQNYLDSLYTNTKYYHTNTKFHIRRWD